MKVLLTLSQQGLDLIKQFEGFRAAPYLDAVGIPTIGYGATYYPGGARVRMTDPPMTEAHASLLLESMVHRFADAINGCVQAPLTQPQFDALVCWAYNVGIEAARHSTLVRLLNEGDCAAAADQFLRWNRAGGRELAGLTRRREAERGLFLSEAAP
ncbi:MAG: lysozyme [Burkholderiaceae bacterium]|jgi:lysozyme|nr:lysozyme [Burkholderiaceae bacterium]